MATNYPNFQYQQQPQTQQLPLQQQINQYPQNQMPVQPSFFLQPIGNIYNLNTASDISNVPAGANISIGLCLSENIMYIKSFQNGAPMLLGYRLSPIEGSVSPSGAVEQEVPAGALKEITERLDHFETQLSRVKEKIGGKLEWQI